MPETPINVDEIAPITEDLLVLATRRTDGILRAWGKQIACYGTAPIHHHDGAPNHGVPTLRQLVIAAYAQGVRDTAAAAAVERISREHTEARDAE